MKRVVVAIAALGVLGGCGMIGGGEEPKTPTVGTRIPVLAAESSASVDPALADAAITLPPLNNNPDWPQPGGAPSKSIGHVALPVQLTRAWQATIGQGSSPRMRLASGPVIGGGRVYTVDTTATVRAFDARTGARLWEAPIGTAEARRGGTSFMTGESTGSRGLLFGGGVSFDNGRVFATSGLGDVAAFDAASGKQLWMVRPGGPLRGAPTVAQGAVYVTSQDNQVFSLKQENGETNWNGSGTLETAGVFGTAAPAAAAGTVVAGFSSGELTAYRYENGRVVWQDALSRTSISIAVASLSDIDAEPVIDNGRVYAIGQGGRMVALELATGQRIWEINLAGLATPWVAGEWLYVVNDDAQLFAIARSSGKIKWMTQLPRWRDEKDREGSIMWYGPLLASDRLVLISSRGRLVNVSPYDGSVQSSVETDLAVSLAPVIAGETLYVLADDGKLTAWR